MKTKNFALIQAIYEKGLTNADLTKLADISSEARLSRIISYRIPITHNEAKRIAQVLEKTEEELGFGATTQGAL